MTILTDPVWFSYNHGHLGMKMYSTDASRSYRESLSVIPGPWSRRDSQAGGNSKRASVWEGKQECQQID